MDRHRRFSARTAVVLTWLIPAAVGVLLALLYDDGALSFYQIIYYFGTFNFRTIALPSSAFDFYNDFFSRHSLTYFCQVFALKAVVNCPYNEPLSIVMQNTYQIGKFNASLFATEGIASVGPMLARLAVLICGLVVSLGNPLSSGLPPQFIMMSSGILPQTFLNVPFTIAMVIYCGSALPALEHNRARNVRTAKRMRAALLSSDRNQVRPRYSRIADCTPYATLEDLYGQLSCLSKTGLGINYLK